MRRGWPGCPCVSFVPGWRERLSVEAGTKEGIGPSLHPSLTGSTQEPGGNHGDQLAVAITSN